MVISGHQWSSVVIRRLVHGAHDRREEKLPTECACECECAPKLGQLMLN